MKQRSKRVRSNFAQSISSFYSNKIPKLPQSQIYSRKRDRKTNRRTKTCILAICAMRNTKCLVYLALSLEISFRGEQIFGKDVFALIDEGERETKRFKSTLVRLAVANQLTSRAGR